MAKGTEIARSGTTANADRVMHIIALAKHKGGTAKTRTPVNSVAALAGYGTRALPIDLDPQANASSWLAADGYRHICAAGRASAAANQIQATGVDGLPIRPASRRLTNASLLRTRLRDCVAPSPEIRKTAGFDCGLLDMPPFLCLMSINALAAPDVVLIRIEPHVQRCPAWRRSST